MGNAEVSLSISNHQHLATELQGDHKESYATKRLVLLARAALQELSWMTLARAGLDKIRDRLK
jgi:hypothetical protein